MRYWHYSLDVFKFFIDFKMTFANIGSYGTHSFSDMEKGADMRTRTLSAEIFEDCGIFLIVEDYAPLFSEENLFLVEVFDETFNIWHI